jgi:hypothetical protein
MSEEEKEIYLAEISYSFGNGELKINPKGLFEHMIIYWDFTESNDVRLYYRPNECEEEENPNGFSFVCVEWISHEYNPIVECMEHQGETIWDDETQVEILFHGWAAYDGIRHFNAGYGEYEGYWHFPDTIALAAMFNQLTELQKKYCHFSEVNFDPKTGYYTYEQNGEIYKQK